MDKAAVFFRLVGSFLYKESTAYDIAYLKEEDIFSELPFARVNPLVLHGQKVMLDWLNEGSYQELAERAASDQMKLFIGAGKVLAPPWGSCYLTEERLIFQEQTLNVRDFYAHYGLKLKKKHSEPDDHIGLELEFLAHLLENNEAEAALRFAREHINTWVFMWCEDVEKSAKTGYYKGLACMATGGIEYFLQKT